MGKSQASSSDTRAIQPKQQLLDNEDSSEDDSEDGGAQLNNNEFKINEEYARRFEHNKKREELQRLEEKYKDRKGRVSESEDDDDSDSSTDVTEDEDGFLATEDLDVQISATLQAIRSKDPKVYDGKTTFYSKDDEPTEHSLKEKKDKPIFLRDYHRENLLRGGVTDEEADAGKPFMTYAQEQDALKQSIVNEINANTEGAGSDEGDDDFLQKVSKPEPALHEHGDNRMHPSRATKLKGKKTKSADLDVSVADKDPELFLSNFMSSRAWAIEDGNKWQAFESDDGEGDDDRAEEWEAAYNMRFEDPQTSNEVLRSYARDVTAAKSVRREEKSGRKRQRELERERKEAEKREREDERARLRRLKIDQTEEKLKKVKKAAGLSGQDLQDEEWMGFLDDAWDDDKWEAEMNKRFGDTYYAQEDDGFEEINSVAEGDKKKHKAKKPTWDDDIDIKDIVPDFEDEEERPDITLTDSEAEQGRNNGVDEEDSGSDDEGDRPTKKQKTGKDRKKERLASQKAARQERAKVEALVDQRMMLDDPALLASSSSSKSQPIRFRYRETSPQSFGLTASDILMAPSDAALNEFAGLKKLAAFRDTEKKRKDKKSLGKKARLRQWRRDTFGKEFEYDGPAFSFGSGGAKTEEEAEKKLGATVEGGEGSRKKRKRSRGKKGKGVS